jgi:hypothetical protein
MGRHRISNTLAASLLAVTLSSGCIGHTQAEHHSLNAVGIAAVTVGLLVASIGAMRMSEDPPPCASEPMPDQLVDFGCSLNGLSVIDDVIEGMFMVVGGIGVTAAGAAELLVNNRAPMPQAYEPEPPPAPRPRLRLPFLPGN